MKKIVTLIALFSTINMLSQAITVDVNTYTVPQLVNNVLINSSCVSASNVNWRTGTNFGSTNGIGYFTNTNPNFPMQSGVILTTGNVLNAVGPNNSMLNDGTNTWLGDAQLETTLLASGISMSSRNATVIEFDFIPVSSHFDFDFLFASEEYGNFQCQFSDAFAFLLTNISTGVTTNLAVVPGTNNPISVVTVRDFLYNSTCNSQNSQYFGMFNGGNNASGAAINYNGQTVVMNASAILTPNTPYRIKLVIADRGDFQSDSAIFLSANSFNIGQEVLGNNLTVANNSALCPGANYTIQSGLNPALYTFQWKKDGVLLNGQTGPNLTITQSGNYELTYLNNSLNCQSITDSILVEYYPEINSPNPNNLYRCDTGASSYMFNLGLNTPIVTQGLNNGSTATYYSSLTDAQNNTNALGTTINSAGNQTVYVKIFNSLTGCTAIKTFELLLAEIPSPIQPIILYNCSSISQPGKAWFSLNNSYNQIYNGLSTSLYSVNFYLTQVNAQNNTNALPTTNYFSSSTTVYASISLLNDINCRQIVPISLIVNELPLVDTLESIITCENYTLPPLTNGNYFSGANGTGNAMFAGDVIEQTQTIYIFNTNSTTPPCNNQSTFTITIIEPEQFDISIRDVCDGYTLPQLAAGDYFTQPGGQGTQLMPGTNLTSNQTVYMYYESILPPFCVIDLSFDLIVTISPQVANYQNVFDCISYTLPSLSNGNYYDAPNGGGNQLAAGSIITETKTIYVIANNGNCSDESSFQVIIGLDFITSVTACAQYTLPVLPVGNYYTQPAGTGTQLQAGTAITTTQNIYVYVPTATTPNCTDNFNFTVTITLPEIVTPNNLTNCGSVTLPSLTVGNYYTGSGGSGNLLNAGDVITTSQTLYVFLDNGNGCQNEVAVPITVHPLPVIDSRPNQTPCNAYTLTNLTNGNYFTGPNGTGTQLPGGTVITNSQTIYIYATNNFGCSIETSFELDIFILQADNIDNVSTCDSYILPALSPNNHYYTQGGGPQGTGTEILAGSAITTTQTIWVYVESAERINCFDENPFNVTITPTPYLPSFQNVRVCNSYTLPSLTIGNYYTGANKTGNLIAAGTVLTTNQTIYVYSESGTTPNCFDQKSFTITIFNVDELTDVTTCESYVLPSITIGNYYNGPNGTGGTISAGTVITTSKTIYVFAFSGYNPNCSDETSFNVTIIDTPVVNSIPVSLLNVCDEDGTNDGITLIDLSTMTSSVLGSQSGNEFQVSYYATNADALNNINPITSTQSTIIYVKIVNSLAPNCFEIKPFTFIIHKLPVPTPQNGIVCLDSETGNVIRPFTIISGLPTSGHTFEWFNANGTIVGTNNSYVATVPGTYSLLVTSNASGCTSEEVFVQVIQSEPALVAYSVSEDFTANQTVTVVATGTGGEYEYQLDDSPFQDSPIFENVDSGIHTITVRDKNGCGITTIEAIVVNYPKFFTPNGDGFNETWNIKDLKLQNESVIFIYDRYGKLLKQIYPSSTGWDGTYNGNMMISDDYWFTISYTKNNEPKEFKAHFALKR